MRACDSDQKAFKRTRGRKRLCACTKGHSDELAMCRPAGSSPARKAECGWCEYVSMSFVCFAWVALFSLVGLVGFHL